MKIKTVTFDQESMEESKSGKSRVLNCPSRMPHGANFQLRKLKVQGSSYGIL